jgi:hypothetical protein
MLFISEVRVLPVAEAMGHNHRCGVLGKRGDHIGRKGSHFLANEILSWARRWMKSRIRLRTLNKEVLASCFRAFKRVGLIVPVQKGGVQVMGR